MNTMKRIWTLRLIEIAILVAGMVVPVLVQHVQMERKKSCFANLCFLEHSINCGVPMAQGLSLGSLVKKADVSQNCRNGVIPRCPSGGDYEFELRVGSRPICPIHGDLIAETGEFPHQPLRWPLQIDFFPFWVRASVMCSAVMALGIPILLYVREKRRKRGATL
jgi:hypothetical protein